MDIEHPDINRIERTGYPDAEFIAWEMNQQEEADEEEWPDGLRFAEWQQQKSAHPAKVNA